MNGTVNMMGVSIGPIHGPFELWSLCDKAQAQQGKLKFNAATQAYGVTVLNSTVTQNCQPGATDDGTQIEEIAVPYLPSVCVGLPIPKGTNCADCPSYGVMPISCTGWVSGPDTIVSPNGVLMAVTRFSSSGCTNTTTRVDQPDGSAIVITILPQITAYYPINSQNPLRLTMRQEMWEDVPNAGKVYLDQTSIMDITKFEVGSLGPANFAHCTPINP
jgi:hypothetical protein